MLHILCVGHVVGLVVRRNSVLSLLESARALLVVLKAAAVPSDDKKELHNVLISLGLHKHGGTLELAVKIGRALPDDERMRALLVLLELDDLLLYRGNVLLPDIYFPTVDSGLPSLCLWLPWYLKSWKAQRLDCLRNVRPTFILPLLWLAMASNFLLVFGHLFHVSNVKGVVFQS
jgi:hypothetical protein